MLGVFRLRMRTCWFVMLCSVAGCVMGSAWAADTIDELARGAVFTFAVVSDNHGASPFTNAGDGRTARFDRADQWIKELGSRFVVGDGDHMHNFTDHFKVFIREDAFWYANFYPGAGDWDNYAYGGEEDAWCTGGALFKEVDLDQRPWVQIRPDGTEYPDGCEYYAQIPVGDWTVHLIHVHYPDKPEDPLLAFRPESRQYLVDTLNSITRGPKDVVIASAHTGSQSDGHWISMLSPEQQQVVMEKCDFAIAGSIHRYERYIHPTYGIYGGCLALNADCISGSSYNGYLQCFVFDNPPRLVSVFQPIDTVASPQLRNDAHNGFYYGYVKLLGQVGGSVNWMDANDDWDAFPAGAQSPDGLLAAGWNAVSVPIDPTDPGAETVFSGLLGGQNSLSRNLMRYDPAEGYQVYPEDFTEIEAGRGYWIKLAEPGRTTIVGTSRSDQAILPVGVGWNMVGPLRTWPVPVSQVRVKKGSGSPVTWFNALQLDWVEDTMYYYEGGSYKTLKAFDGDDDRFRPWHSYWIKVKTSDLSLVFPPGVEPTPVVKIGDIEVVDITPTTAVVNWSSLVFSTSEVRFGLTDAYTDTTGVKQTLTRLHSMQLTGLAPATDFHYQVVSTGDLYDPGVSEDAVFTTASSPTLPADAGFESGGLTEWIAWPEGSDYMQVGSYSPIGKIYPHSGSAFAYTRWLQETCGGGLYARVAAVPGRTYRASVWSNIFMASSPPIPAGACRSRVGIDPTGGRDPLSASIVWSGWDTRTNAQLQEWRQLTCQAQAQAGIVTIFLEFGQNAQPQYYQMVNAFDDASIEQLSP